MQHAITKHSKNTPMAIILYTPKVKSQQHQLARLELVLFNLPRQLAAIIHLRLQLYSWDFYQHAVPWAFPA